MDFFSKILPAIPLKIRLVISLQNPPGVIQKFLDEFVQKLVYRSIQKFLKISQGFLQIISRVAVKNVFRCNVKH